MLTPRQAAEWSDAAMYIAKRSTGHLPPLLQEAVWNEIQNYPEEWEDEVRLAKYTLARERRGEV